MDRRTFIGAAGDSGDCCAAYRDFASRDDSRPPHRRVISRCAADSGRHPLGGRAVARTRLGGGPESARRTTLRQRKSRAPPTLRGGARSAQGGDHRDAGARPPPWRPRTPRPPYPSSSLPQATRSAAVSSRAWPGLAAISPAFPLLARSSMPSVSPCCASCCRACNALACWRIRPTRTFAPCVTSSSRHAGPLACSRSLSKSPRQASWRMRSRRWLAGERKRYLCMPMICSTTIGFRS